MPQSSTITVVDKQRSGDKPTSPTKIMTETGDVYKVWADKAFELQVGETYDVGIEKVPSKNLKYPNPDYFIVEVSKAKGNGQSPMGIGGEVGAREPPKSFKGAATATDWNEVGIQKHTGELFAVMWLPSKDPSALLDECRALWIAHVARSKTPAVKLVTKEELVEDDYDDFK